ncbi:MAG: ABC transporter permease [Candidatus Bathyarchaeota archaeon]|nr:ABC transporter permease [Candidatus Bathyarchaeota archaeon]
MTAKDVINHSLRIAWKDTVELYRNRLGLVLLVVMPLFMMVMVGFIYPSGGVSLNNAAIGLVNDDSGVGGNTLPSQAFIAALQGINQQADLMNLQNASSIIDVKEQIQRGTLSGAIIIPENFTASMLSGQQGTIIIMTDQSNPQISATIQGVLSGVFSEMGTQTALANLNTTNIAIVEPYDIASAGVVEGSTNYFDFIAPGIMAMTVMMSVMTGLPVAISMEKEIGTMDGMMVAPINRLSILLGKTLAQTARGLLQGAIILGLAIGIFGVTIHGSILLVFGLLLLGVFSFVGLGIVITSFTKDQETAQMLMMTLMFPMMFLSGVFFPIQNMPAFM